MAFINALLDEQVAYGFEGGPEYFTGETLLENGLRISDSGWEYPRHKYRAQFDNLADEDRDAIINVFHACRGKRHSFKFKDWNDYTAVEEPLAVPAPLVGTTGVVQLYKTHSFGEAFTIRPVQALAPLLSTHGVFKKVGAVLTPVAGVFDMNLGTFVPTSAWEVATYVWSGEFYVWVHFVDDYNAFTINSWRASTANVELEEDKRAITAANVPLSWEE